jgi:hypothetical protein
MFDLIYDYNFGISYFKSFMTVTLNGGNTNAAEKSLPFHGSASILMALALVTPLPPYWFHQS